MGGVHGFPDNQGENRRLLVALDGRVKFSMTLAALLLNLAAGGVRFPLGLLVVTLCCCMVSGVRLRSFVRRMAVPLMLALVACATQIFWYPLGEPLVSIPLFGSEVVIREAALWRGLELGSRILGGMSVLLFFSLTTPLPELMRAARFFRCPAVLMELVLIMYRYIFLMFAEAGRIRTAQKARLGFVSFGNTLRSAGTLGGMLVLRSYDRAERSFAAMRCRGYRGTITVVPPGQLRPHDWGVLLASGIILALLWQLR